MPFSGPANAAKDLILRSMFAESEGEYLRFRYEGETQTLELIQSPYVASLPAQAFAWLEIGKNFPAFLSTIVIEGSEKQTMSSTIMQG
jgi:hypothetical protein